jgi:hypothetical protein
MAGILEPDLLAWLLTKTAVTDLVGQRIYNVRLPQGGTFPALAIERISGPREYQLDGPAGLASPRIQFNCHGEEFSDAKMLAEAVRQTLDTLKHTELVIGGVIVGSAECVDERHGFDPVTQNMRIELDYVVWHNE